MRLSKATQFFLVAFLVLALFFLLDIEIVFTSQTPTELEIQSASIYFNIYQGGKYSCNFYLRGLGNERTAQSYAKCEFRISDNQTTNFSILLYDSPINSSLSINENSSICTFILDREIPIGTSFLLLGNFKGNFQENNSGIYTFQLGINWGTFVQVQQITVSIDKSEKIIPPIIPQPDEMIITTENTMALSWSYADTDEFNTQLTVFSRTSETHFLAVDLTSWEASLGQSIEVQIQNNGPLVAHVYVHTPTWIDSNTTYSSLISTQNLTILFSLNSEATVGVNGTIEIISEELWEVIRIPVFVLYEEIPVSNYNDFFVPILVMSLVAITVLASVLLYNKRATIQKVVQKLMTSSEALNEGVNEGLIPWESVHSRWEAILPEQELKVLEILFIQGSMNQQAIARQMGVSKVTTSRIISRLEMKKLLIRNRYGVSKMIKLRKDRL
ncbi:MAG: helix-turn-helix transcriptional regulator [Candidatus Hodarchaeota archaeon]